MNIRSAEFFKSSTKLAECPKSDRMEFAFIGRSNVGKSSLINALTSHKGLAKTSQVPGKTQLINHFIVNDSFFIVDLPGYGYAKVSKAVRAKFERMIWEYITEREQMVNLFVLIDLRHKPMQVDLDFIHQLGMEGIPFSIVFTKADKVKQNERQKNISTYKSELLKTWEILPPIFVTSAETQEGCSELLDYIEEILSANLDQVQYRSGID
ncbi:MAG: ribosome biogenesis GTP-binding protein YihA/YsxC [Porphyromonas sp.]|nr:ribosome biogenesis GTP-binding protein YihA/YsxC [Porphyromonas sp.]